MSGRRPRTRQPLLAAASAGLVSYALWIRPQLLHWGATRAETTRAYPGDELLPDPDVGATMATTLPAPPEKVWPWLVQMGGDRGGWYSWDWLDNDGRPSADRIVPGWQSLEEGQHLYTAPNGPSRFVVAVLEPNQTLVLRGDYSKNIDGIWGFHLRPAAGGSTRLVARTRSRGLPRLIGLLWSEPVHFIMQTRQFQNLRTRVGAEAECPSEARRLRDIQRIREAGVEEDGRARASRVLEVCADAIIGVRRVRHSCSPAASTF